MMRGPAIFLAHGGGPMPVLGEPSQKELADFIKTKCRKWLGTPKAIIMVTAHWETEQVNISGGSKHELLYDYYGFPKSAYCLEYPCQGHPQLAQEIKAKLGAAGISSNIDTKRGWDHGVFIPMLMMRPEADIPIVQVSVLANQNAESLLEYGKALSEFRDQGIAIVGSGMSFHNMAAFMNPVGNHVFEAKLQEAVKMEAEPRLAAFKNWRDFPAANDCHPLRHTEHFSPFLVVLGAAGNDKLAASETVQCFKAQVTNFLF